MLTLFGERILFDNRFPDARDVRRRRRDHRPASWLVTERGCWLWEGPTSKGGYPKLGLNRGTIAAHRWIYEQIVGPIPKDMTLDHTCRQISCVNPEHLEPCSRVENIQRAVAYRKEMADILGYA